MNYFQEFEEVNHGFYGTKNTDTTSRQCAA
jgi:hypothetical protein